MKKKLILVVLLLSVLSVMTFAEEYNAYAEYLNAFFQPTYIAIAGRALSIYPANNSLTVKEINRQCEGFMYLTEVVNSNDELVGRAINKWADYPYSKSFLNNPVTASVDWFSCAVEVATALQ